MQICKEYHSKVYKLEGDKWDLERGIKIRILEVHTRVISALTLLIVSRLRSGSNLETQHGSQGVGGGRQRAHLGL